MTWNVELLNGVNNINFGMSRNEVRKLINLPYKEVNSIIGLDLYEDNFDDSCSVEYDSSFKMTSITIYDTENIYISGIRAFPIKPSIYRKFADDLIREGDGYVSRSKSIGISAPNGEILSVTFGKKDYYEFMFKSYNDYDKTDKDFLSKVIEDVETNMKKEFPHWDFFKTTKK